MSEEMFDVVDQEDRVLYQSPRSVVHANHWLHRAVHIFVFNRRGELLIHRRSATKDEAPLKYTSSASGHLSAGEDYATAAVRELEEELGLKASVEFLGIFPANGAMTSFEHSGLYRAITDDTPIFDPEEILSGEFRPLDEIEAMIARDPDDFTHCFRSLFRWFLTRDQDGVRIGHRVSH
jgi:isopentenyl-diphosphate delta-isomerase